MFSKRRIAPYLMETLPRLERRLPKNHASRKLTAQHHYQITAGFGGEQEVDKKLEKMRWHTERMVLCDFHLQSEIQPCQIDTVILTPFYALVLEVKNYSGSLDFKDGTNHMEQTTREGDRFGFHSPINQVLTASEELEILLRQLAIPLPIYPVVVLPYSRTLYTRAPETVPVVYAHSLGRFISRLPRTGHSLTSAELAAVSEQVLAHHTPFPKINYQKEYFYQPEQLRTGVLCAQCDARAIKESERIHACRHCGTRLDDGYAQALEDWFEFASPTINNAQCRRFLELKDKHAATYLLKKMNLSPSGHSTQRSYTRV
ncbi:nuclease-related domain-containing protein [Planococcus salinus]|nr:nuclease-related domain-containing protein [Planococcus salinus]